MSTIKDLIEQEARMSIEARGQELGARDYSLRADACKESARYFAERARELRAQILAELAK
jgi:hypothetical protein